ncbi:MAG TPA: hypothetical protein ENH41_03360 [Candidatus Omnitrophica bacterium]|nr:hypothetical protein [Candidatus Omnitrophota bacterium]
MVKSVKTNKRKFPVMIMLTGADTEFLDRKIQHNNPLKNSRSAILRLLVEKAKANPALLDTK